MFFFLIRMEWNGIELLGLESFLGSLKWFWFTVDRSVVRSASEFVISPKKMNDPGLWQFKTSSARALIRLRVCDFSEKTNDSGFWQFTMSPARALMCVVSLISFSPVDFPRRLNLPEGVVL